ncbi:acyltransferase [Algibacter marinivivus]|uniref:Acyltransferase n=1 Tax=Algibacter marinivivus TaxID=2100723 RepID=A0A2U2X4U6_9FLAO|nr:acyltransferase [Algibacter marinivivus]PWH82805.1 acyltransferase [Algibacter marinivivus]
MNKNNNFDFLRFLFALLVVISHSYPLSGNDESSQWIYQVTQGQIVLARIGLSGFFVISGFFIYRSLQRSESLFSYFKKRFLRIFPGLFVVLLLSVLLIPFVYEGQFPLTKNESYFTYLPNNLLLYNFQGVVNGVFNANPYHAINGSLWTIRYEFSLYIALSLLYFFRKSKKVQKGLLSLCFLGLIILNNFFLTRFSGSSIFGMLGFEILDLGTFFVGGSLLATFNFEKIKNKWILFIAFLALLISIYFQFYNAIKHVILPVIILLLGFATLPFFNNFGKIGDMSYGIYIYSFPVQQALVYYYKLDVYQLMFFSIIISITLGYLSWHLIEKKALAYKNKPIFNVKYFNK